MMHSFRSATSELDLILATSSFVNPFKYLFFFCFNSVGSQVFLGEFLNVYF